MRIHKRLKVAKLGTKSSLQPIIEASLLQKNNMHTLH